MKRSHPLPPGRAFFCLAFVAASALCASGPDPDGWVMAVGQWTRGGHPLKRYDSVLAKDKLQGISGDIVVALKDGQPPHTYHCDKLPCTVTVPEFRPAPDSLLARLGRAFDELASHRATMPVSAISRGAEPLRQAVLAFGDGRLELQDAVRPIDAGLYTVSLRPIETVPSTTKGPFKASVHWEPPEVTSASFADLAPGIYELTMTSPEGESLGSVAVLVANAADYPARRQSFEASVQSLPRDLDRETLDAFLNALLFDIGSPTK